MSDEQQTDDTKISVFRDGRFTQNMIVAGLNAAGGAAEKKGISEIERLILVISASFAAMIKAYDVQQEGEK